MEEVDVGNMLQSIKEYCQNKHACNSKCPYFDEVCTFGRLPFEWNVEEIVDKMFHVKH